MQSSVDFFRVVSGASTGESRKSVEKQLQIELGVAHHLGLMRSLLSFGAINENYGGNTGVTQLDIKVEHG